MTRKNNRALRILVVDDDPENIMILKEQLERRGFDVDSAVNGNDAIRISKERPPDLIILDIIMPQLDGTQLADYFKQNKTLANVPIFFVTCLQTKQEETELGKVGASRIFSKPVDIEKLVYKINEVTGT